MAASPRSCGGSKSYNTLIMGKEKQDKKAPWPQSWPQSPLLEPPGCQEVAVSPERSQNMYNIPPKAFLFRHTLAVWGQSHLSRERRSASFLWHPECSELLPALPPPDSPLSGPGQNREGGEQGCNISSCQVSGVVKPTTEDWLHL